MPTVLPALRSPASAERVFERLLPREGSPTVEAQGEPEQLTGDPPATPAATGDGVGNDNESNLEPGVQLRSETSSIRIQREGRGGGEGAVPEPPQEVRNAVAGKVTHYGESYNGQPLGCTGRPYSSSDATIAASAWRPDGSRPYRCGQLLYVAGPAGGITVTVQDACPGCAWNHIDLSESGIEAVCGGRFTCAVTITRIE